MAIIKITFSLYQGRVWMKRIVYSDNRIGIMPATIKEIKLLGLENNHV